MIEIHHRIKNNLSTVSSLLSHQARRAADPTAALVLKDAEARVHSMGSIYERLYRTGNYRMLNAREYLFLLLTDIGKSMQMPDSRVTLVQDIEAVPFDIHISFPLGIFINECVTNAFKYAFPDGRSGMIRVSLKRAGNCLEVTVADDGIGLPGEVDVENPINFGLNLVKLMADQVSGELTVSREGGTSFQLSVPIENTDPAISPTGR